MKNFEYCAYTYKHRQAIKYLINKLIVDERLRAEMLRRAEVHDMDKMVMYQVLDYAEAHKIHTQTTAHHVTNSISKSYYDYVEAVLDYESAGYTKPDKPLNAYDFIIKMKTTGRFSEELCQELLNICEKLGIASSYFVTDDTAGVEHLNQFNDVSEEMIIEELRKYFNQNID